QGPEDNIEEYFEIFEGKIVGIKVYPNTQDQNHFKHQEKLTKLLSDCKPVLKSLKATQLQSLEEVFLDYVETNLQVPVIAVARGPRASDREIRKGWELLFNPTES